MIESATKVVRPYYQKGHLNQDNEIIKAKKLKVAAYCRVSTDSDEQLNSYAVQVEYYTRYIKSKSAEWDFVGIYADEGITGTSARKRKEFQRMIADALDGKIDMIIVKSVSRYARNVVDALSHIRQLREKGIKLYFEKENIDSLDPKCDLILNIYSSLAEEESRSISTNIRWSVQKRFEKGELIMNFANFLGYKKDENGNVVVIPEEAETIKDIYFMFIEGKSMQDIVDNLESKGLKTPSGKDKLAKSTIKSILQNEKYIGDAILQKTYKRDFLDPKRVKNTGQAKQNYVENNHPAIIDRNMFAAVQAEFEKRNSLRNATKTGKGKYTGKYAFSGIIECGSCGATYRRHIYLNHNKKEFVWSCITHLDRGKETCDQLPIKENYLEELFVKTFNKLLTNKENILDEIKINIKSALLECEIDNSKLNRTLKDIDNEIEKNKL